MDSRALELHAALGYSQSSYFSIPGTKVEQGHFVEANFASSMGVVVVERRVDSSQKVVGMVLDTYLSS